MGKPGKPKGLPKSGGRKAGTPNKKSNDLWAICEHHNVHPFEAMILIAIAETDKHRQFEMWERIAQYVHPKRKALEVAGNNGEPISVEVKDAKHKEELIRRLQDKKNERG